MSLARIGFTVDETFECDAWPDGRLLVRAELQGESAHLLLDTACHLDLSLRRGYTQHRDFVFERRTETWVMCSVTEFSALGRSRPHDVACAFGADVPAPEPSTYAGSLGTLYLNDAILALDAAGPCIGFSTRAAIRERFSDAVCRIPLLPDVPDRMPVTQAIPDRSAPDALPTFLLSTGSASSVSLEYTRRNWPRLLRWKVARAHRKHSTIALPLGLPNGSGVEIKAFVVDRMPEYVSSGELPRIDGVLGVDFLRRWIQVFDFPGGELALFDY